MNVKGNENRSVRETKMRIQQTFLQLMQKKPYTKISIREISEQANINRSTFYLHYQDVYDLMEQIEDELLCKMKEALRKISRENYVPGKHPQHTGVFQVMMENYDLCRILMSDNGDISFVYRFSKVVDDTMHACWSAYLADKKKVKNLDMYVSYVTHGMVGIYLDQLRSRKKWTAEEMGYFAGEVTNWIDETFVKYVDKD